MVLERSVHRNDHQCRLCPHACIYSMQGAYSFCRNDPMARCYRHRIEYGEERSLIPSHLFYLSGCNMRCRFCIGEEQAVDSRIGTPLTEEFFCEAVRWGQQQGARNIQWVGGEPSIHLEQVLSVMEHCEDLPPVVWKSNFYLEQNTLDRLFETVSVFVADLKFGNNRCAETIAAVKQYWETVTERLRYVACHHHLIVRHLFLPGHFECCFVPIVQWMKQNLPNVEFSFREGYIPAFRAKGDPVLGRWPSKDEIRKARDVLNEYDLCAVY